MNFFKYNKETGKIESTRGSYRSELKKHYQYEGSPQLISELINKYAPEIRNKTIIPKISVQKIIDGFGYVCEEEE